MTAIFVSFLLAVFLVAIAVVMKAHHGDHKPFVLPVPDLWEVPDQTGNSMSFSQFLSMMNTNGRYDRDTKEWIDQHQPQPDDLVLILTMDSSQAIIVDKDERGRVVSTQWSSGWGQDAVSVRVEGQEKLRQVALSDLLPTPMNNRIWVAFI